MVKQMVKQSSENGAKKALQGVLFHIRKKKKTSDNSLIITRLSRVENGNRISDFFPLFINSLRDFLDLEVTDAPELICASIPLHTTIQR